MFPSFTIQSDGNNGQSSLQTFHACSFYAGFFDAASFPTHPHNAISQIGHSHDTASYRFFEFIVTRAQNPYSLSILLNKEVEFDYFVANSLYRNRFVIVAGSLYCN